MGEISVCVLAPDEGLAGALSAYLDAEPALTLVSGAAEVVVAVDPQPRSTLMALAEESALLVIGPDGGDDMIRALEAGALGYLPSFCAFGEVRDAIFAMAEGEAVVPPYMLGTLLRHVVERRRASAADLERLDRLTNREREVFELLAQGHDRESIARRLFISVGTVRTHLQRLFLKLEIHTHAEVVALAARCGIDIHDHEESH